VAMGRAIVRQPVAFLLDEPLSNLDARLRVQTRTEIARLQRNLGTTTVYVTHDQTEAMTLGQRVAVLRKGVVQQIGTPRELYAEPRNLFVAGFIGSPAMNFVPGEIRDGRLVLPMTEVALPGKVPDGPVIAGIRPEQFEDAALVDAKSSVFEVKVDVLEWLGADLYVHFQVECAAERLRGLPDELERKAAAANRIAMVARVDPSSKAAENQRLRLWLDASQLQLFDPKSGEKLAR
jgi:multiple sugar transport system ATP-binding protein